MTSPLLSTIVFKTCKIRVFGEADVPLFPVTDITCAMELKDSHKFLQSQDENDLQQIIVDSNTIECLNKTGIYSALKRSRKLAAKELNRCIEDELYFQRRLNESNSAMLSIYSTAEQQTIKFQEQILAELNILREEMSRLRSEITPPAPRKSPKKTKTTSAPPARETQEIKEPYAIKDFPTPAVKVTLMEEVAEANEIIPYSVMATLDPQIESDVLMRLARRWISENPPVVNELADSYWARYRTVAIYQGVNPDAIEFETQKQYPQFHWFKKPGRGNRKKWVSRTVPTSST